METQLLRLTFPLPEGLGPFSETRSLEELKVDSYNKTPGNLTGYDCPKCRNRGTHAVLREDKEICIEDCECMRIRRFVRAAEKSGLRNMLEEKRFQKFEDKEPWQKEMKRLAMEYAAKLEGWLLMCGQPGSGKTHLCVAVCREALKRGMEVYYMAWRETIASLKQFGENSARRQQLLDEIKNVELLYVDDLFKTGPGTDGVARPTAADVSLAFEIINYRVSSRKATIISTEKTPDELVQIDEGTGSRIIEHARGQSVVITRDPSRNYRMIMGK